MFTNKRPITKNIAKTIAILVAILIISLPIIGYAANQTVTFDNEVTKMNDALKKAYQNYAGDIDIEEFIRAAIDGALESLEDPYTEYYTAEEYKQFMGAVDMNLVGIGIFLEKKDDEIIVVRSIPNTPAAKAGILANDRILQVNNEPTDTMSLNDVVSRIRGTAGTRVSLLLKRGNQEISIWVTRAAINVPNVYTSWYDGVAYFEIITFGEQAASQFKNGLSSLKARYSHIDGIIIDVRNNTGGRLDSVLEIADVVLQNQLIVSIVDKDNKRTLHSSGYDTPAARIPTVILVNGLSASASEILAGALQDHKAATVVGTTTFGKGTVQNLVPVLGGGYVKVTTAEYLRPSNRTVNKVGITPDFLVEDSTAQLAKALDILQPSKPLTISMKINDYQATLRGQKVNMTSKPFIEANVPYVPYRLIIEAFGGTVSWNEATLTSETLWQGQRLYLDQHNVRNPLMKVDNRMYISLLDLERFYGVKGSFNPLTHQIDLRN